MAASTLTACSFFTHDNERDMQQVIASIDSYTITNSVKTTDEKGNEVITKHDYVTPQKTIYKRDLVEYVNNNASSLSQSYGNDIEGLYKYAAQMLVNIELVTNEVDALIECGNIEWGVKDQNAVKKNIYSVIDNTITSLKNTILEERDQETITNDSSDSVNTETTYPVKPDPTEDDELGDAEKPNDEPVWEPELARYPGYVGDESERSLGKEAMRRFIELIKESVEDDFRITSEERAKFDKEIAAINKLIDEKGVESVYGVIGNYPLSDDSDFGYLMYRISGESYERSQKISALQSYLTDGITVSDEEVEESYRSLLNEQRAQYTADPSAYDTAISGGNTTILYNQNANYFYVKHILLPFSDDQKAALTAYQNRADVASLEDTEKDKLVKAYRAELANSIIAYPHENGEDDLSKPMTVDQIMSHVRSIMLGKEANVASADVAFDDLIYLYNTDPGAFGNNKGYVVKEKLADGESETYMQEFADAARYMRRNLEVGQVYYEPVITDYGVHIMYLASVVTPGEVSLNDYTTPGKLEKYYDILKAPILTSRESAVYTKWENNILTYNYKQYSKVFEDTFKNLWEA